MNSRVRGVVYEREIAHELELELGIPFVRDLEQVRTAGRGDLITDPSFPFVIECKRRATGSYSGAWMEQAEQAAKRAGKMPVVIFRFDRQKSVVALPTYVVAALFGWGEDYADLKEPMFTSLPNFCTLAREQMG